MPPVGLPPDDWGTKPPSPNQSLLHQHCNLTIRRPFHFYRSLILNLANLCRLLQLYHLQWNVLCSNLEHPNTKSYFLIWKILSILNKGSGTNGKLRPIQLRMLMEQAEISHLQKQL